MDRRRAAPRDDLRHVAITNERDKRLFPGLSAEEKDELENSVLRFAQGINDGTIVIDPVPAPAVPFVFGNEAPLLPPFTYEDEEAYPPPVPHYGYEDGGDHLPPPVPPYAHEGPEPLPPPPYPAPPPNPFVLQTGWNLHGQPNFVPQSMAPFHPIEQEVQPFPFSGVPFWSSIPALRMPDNWLNEQRAPARPGFPWVKVEEPEDDFEAVFGHPPAAIGGPANLAYSDIDEQEDDEDDEDRRVTRSMTLKRQGIISPRKNYKEADVNSDSQDGDDETSSSDSDSDVEMVTPSAGPSAGLSAGPSAGPSMDGTEWRGWQCLQKNCDCGNRYFMAKSSRDKHMDLAYPPRYQCSKCKTRFRHSSSGTTHLNTSKRCKAAHAKVICLSEVPHWKKPENRGKLIKPCMVDPLWEELGFD